MKGVFLKLHFTDLAGILRSTMISADAGVLDRVEDINVMFDASSVYGFEAIENSDLELRPFKDTLTKIPWVDGVYRVIAGVYEPGGVRYVKDPRLVTENLVRYLRDLGYEARVGVEMEYFIFNKLEYMIDYTRQYIVISSIESMGSHGYIIAPKKGYHLPEPYDSTEAVRRKIMEYMEAMGYRCIKSHHEVAGFGQQEVASILTDPIRLADFIQTFKYVARNTAAMHGLTAVFMPKPIPWDNGSGMHIHVSLWDTSGSRNLFYDENEPGGLSGIARYFIGGLIEHGRSLSAIVSPTVNSYKRLIPGYEAPVYLVWGIGNRSAAIRVPVTRSPKTMRIEYRPPDPCANPYLAVAALIMAGVDGIRKKIDPGDPFEANVYHLKPSDRVRLGIRELPKTLYEALEELESDNEYLKPVFPRELLESYIEMKYNEAREVMSYPSPAEFHYYITI